MCDCDEVKTRARRRPHVIYVRESPASKTCSPPLKVLVVLLAFMVVCCLILLNLYLIERGKPPTQTYDEKAVNTTPNRPEHGKSYGGSCWTSDCLRAASDLLDSIDPSKDPCEDFFHYACGGWEKKNRHPNGSKVWNQFQKLSSKNDKLLEILLIDKEIRAKYSKEDAVLKTFAFYDSCTDVQSIERLKGEPLERLIKRLGSCSITDKKWNETGWDLAAKLAEIHKNLERFVFFRMAVEIDHKNSSQHVLEIRKSPLYIIRAKDFIGNDTFSQRIREAYQGMMRNLSRKLGATEDSEAELLEIFDFERELAKIVNPYGPSRISKRMTLRNLQERTGKYLMVKEVSVQIDESYEIDVVDIDFFKRLVRLLSDTPKRTIANYLMWAVVKGYFHLLSSDFLEIYKNYFQQTFKVWTDTERQRLCVVATSFSFPMPLSKVFLDHIKFDAESKTRAKEIIENIRATFISNLRQEDWLDENTKKIAIMKAEAVSENIGFPDYLIDVNYLSKEYKEVAIAPTTYFENFVAVRKYDHLKRLAKAEKPVRKSDWSITPMKVNAVYFHKQNKMVFPAAILQPPFFNVLYPRAINYGAIGGIMAHEITHGFDDNGNKFDSQGNLRKWWSNATLKVFHEKSQCLVKQYSNFTYFGQQIDGKGTLSENIADNGAVRVAYDVSSYLFLTELDNLVPRRWERGWELEAYRKWINEHWEESRLPGMMLANEQIFFISYAKNMCGYVSEGGEEFMRFFSKYSPWPWRVNGPLMNFPGFSKAFKCPLGSAMNPEKKCKIW